MSLQRCNNCPSRRKLSSPYPQCENEQCKYRYQRISNERCETKCHQCTETMQQIREFLDEIISKSEESPIIGVCKCCRRVTAIRTCNKCGVTASNYFIPEGEKYKHKFFVEWLSKLKCLLKNLLHSHSICKHTLCGDTELERILKEIPSPISRRKPVIEYFPNIKEGRWLIQSISESKELLGKLLNRVQRENEPTCLPCNDSVSTASCIDTCICKLLKKELPEAPPPSVLEDKFSVTLNMSPIVEAQLSPEKEVVSSFKPQPTKVSVRKARIAPGLKASVSDSMKVERRKSIKSDAVSLYSLKKQMASKTTKEDKKSDREKNVLNKTYDRENDDKQKYINKQLADALAVQAQLVDVKSSSIVDCQVKSDSPKFTVKNILLKPYEAYIKLSQSSQLLTKKEYVFESFNNFNLPSKPGIEPNLGHTADKRPIRFQSQKKDLSGVVRYQLSDRSFIENGWTQLPQQKLMRRMNLYKMEPVNVKNNWFERNKDKGTVYYDSGELLSQINQDGSGVLFYRNGSIALEYCNAKEEDYGLRSKVYSCVDRGSSKEKVHSLLAEFDYLGNGVIYDNSGTVRLIYNQTEGAVIDPKIAHPCHWKWHALNEPPVLKMLYINSYMNPKDSLIQTLASDSQAVKPDNTSPTAVSELLMQQLEAAQLVHNKLRTNFKQFVMTTKIAKLSEHFAVRIGDQSNISITYRNKSTAITLSLGLVLNSTQIIGFDFCEAKNVQLLQLTK